MNHIVGADGNQETRVKIVRNESIGSYAWDTGGDFGITDWSVSTLRNYLNTTYLNSISLESQVMISSALWNLGGLNGEATSSEIIYNMERGTVVYGSNALTWTGSIVLVYPSDIRFAVGGSNRETCLAKGLGSWRSSGCVNSAWITGSRWTFTHRATSAYASFRFNGSYLLTSNVRNKNSKDGTYPTLYLKSNVQIISGDGSSSSPYELDFKE